MENSKIEWCDHTFNPWVGCTKVSPACDHCYAEGWAKRSGNPELWNGERRRTSTANWRKVIKWDTAAAVEGRRARVFCASLADVFDNQAEPEWRADLWRLIEVTPNLDWLLLTKRPQNIAKMLPPNWGDGWPNVWLGTTVENQEEADRRIPHLLEVPARIRFLSCEPLLGPVELYTFYNQGPTVYFPMSGGVSYDYLGADEDGKAMFGDVVPGPRIHMVIAGGESGGQARPMHPDWVRSLRNQCAAAGVAFHFKQWGEWLAGENFGEPLASWQDGTSGIHPSAAGKPASQCPEWRHFGTPGDPGAFTLRVGKKRSGRLLDGVQHDGFPA